MKLCEFPLLTDENLDPDVVDWLVQEGFDVLDVCRAGLQGTSDIELLKRATQENRVVVTHDSDFGTLAAFQGEPAIGILFLRPGHIDPKFTIETIKSVLQMTPEVVPPFILVAKRMGQNVTIRLREIS